MIRIILLGILVIVAVPLLVWAARRFERRQQERGLWNQRGPINPQVRQRTDSEIAYGVRFPRIEHEPLPPGEVDRLDDVPPRER